MRYINTLFFLTLIILSPTTKATGISGYGIAVEVDKRLKNYIDSSSNVVMVLVSETGEETERELSIKTKQYEGTNISSRSLIEFSSPANIAETALLSWSQIGVDDRQWLYMPELGRTRAISSAGKHGSFMGSEFSYADLQEKNIDDYEYNLLSTVLEDSVKYYLVSREHKDTDVGIVYEELKIRSDDFVIVKIDQYDHLNRHVKTFEMSDFRNFGELVRPMNVIVFNLLNSRSTRLLFSDYNFDTGVSDRIFTQSGLQTRR